MNSFLKIIFFTFYFIIFHPYGYGQQIPYDKEVTSIDHIPLQNGDRITILAADRSRFTGLFISIKDGYLLLESKDTMEEMVDIRIIEYLRIEKDKSKRSREYGIWGAVIGLFSGIPIGSHMIKNRDPEDSAGDGFIYAGAAATGAAAGGLIGICIGLITLPNDIVYRIIP